MKHSLVYSYKMKDQLKVVHKTMTLRMIKLRKNGKNRELLKKWCDKLLQIS